MILYKLLELIRNTSNSKTLCKLFVLDWNTCYHIIMWKQIIIINNSSVDLAVEYTDCILLKGKTRLTSSLNKTLKYLMARFHLGSFE